MGPFLIEKKEIQLSLTYETGEQMIGCCLTMRKNQVLIHAMECMNHKFTNLSEITHSTKSHHVPLQNILQRAK